MALLDMLLGGRGGLLGGLPAPNDPVWKQILAQQNLGGPGPAMDASAIGGAAPDLSGIRDLLGGLGRTLMGPGPAMDASAMGGALPQDQFGAGAQPTSLYGVNPSGFGFQRPGPNPIPLPTNPQGPPVALLENRPSPRLPPVPADPNLPPVSRPTQGQMPSSPQAPSAALSSPLNYGGGDLGAAFQNFTHGRTLIGALGDALTGGLTGQRTDPAGAYQQAATQTFRALKAAGYPDADAALAATNPDVLKQIVTNAYQQPKFEKAGPGEAAYLVGGGLGRLGPGGGGPSGVGGAGVTQLTPGMSVQEKAAQEAAGQAQGQAAAKLPAALSAADQALALVKQVQEHPGRNSISSSGPLAKLPAVPGTDAYNYRAAVSQLKSQAFLSAFNTLRGGGQISNVEGEKATEAMVQLDLAQSQAARDKAISTLRGVIETGRENAIKMAQGRTEAFPTPETPSAPQTQVGGAWTTGKVGGQPYRIRQVQ